MKNSNRDKPYEPCIKRDPTAPRKRPALDTGLAINAWGEIAPRRTVAQSHRLRRAERSSFITFIVMVTFGLPFLLIMGILVALGVVQSGRSSGGSDQQ